jgi:hypothetical protein
VLAATSCLRCCRSARPARSRWYITVNLYDNIRRLKLDVRQIAALHGPRVATLAELQSAAGARPTTSN